MTGANLTLASLLGPPPTPGLAGPTLAQPPVIMPTQSPGVTPTQPALRSSSSPSPDESERDDDSSEPEQDTEDRLGQTCEEPDPSTLMGTSTTSMVILDGSQFISYC